MSAPRLLLFFSVLCAVVSITPLADDWRVLVRLTPEWASHPNGYPYLMPHEVLADAIVSGWQGLLQAAANSAWLTDAQAAALKADGLPLAGVLQTIAATLFVAAAFLWALASVRSPKADPAAGAKHTEVPQAIHQPSFQEPVMPAIAPSTQSVGPAVPTSTLAKAPALSIEQRLADLELQVANLLLNPDAQPVAEELVELNRDLRELSRAVTSSNSNRS